MKKSLSVFVVIAFGVCGVSVLQAATVPVTDNLVLWLDADSANINGGGVSDGAEVTAWADSTSTGSGTGDNASQDATQDGSQPTPNWIQNGIAIGGGQYKPVVRFNEGTNQGNQANWDKLKSLTGLGITGTAPAYTAFIVARLETAGGIQRAIQFGHVVGTDGPGKSVGFDVSTAGYRFNNGNRLYTDTNEKFDAGTVRIGTWRAADGATYNQGEYYRDGNLGVQNSSAGPTNKVSPQDEGYTVGAGWSKDANVYIDRFDGDIAEFLLYSDELTDTEFQQVGVYLEQKYGLDTAFIPEPATVGLLVLGGGVLLVRRKRRAV